MSRPIDAGLWQRLTQEVTSAMAAWRLEHPTATLREIELELDARLNAMRARMLEDLAFTSSAAAWTAAPACQHPRCSECDQALQSDGSKQRLLQTHGGQQLSLQRSYGVCPTCGVGLFPPR